jgi:hypothetical protein
MTITVGLIQASPHKLRYLCTSDGTSPDTVTIANDGGGTPDLLTDIESVGVVPGVSGIPLRAPIRARLDGFSNLPAGTVLNQAQARAILLSDDGPGGPLIVDGPLIVRTYCYIDPRSFGVTNTFWAVDVDVDGQGDPVVVVTLVGADSGDTAIVEIVTLHSTER